MLLKRPQFFQLGVVVLFWSFLRNYFFPLLSSVLGHLLFKHPILVREVSLCVMRSWAPRGCYWGFLKIALLLCLVCVNYIHIYYIYIYLYIINWLIFLKTIHLCLSFYKIEQIVTWGLGSALCFHSWQQQAVLSGHVFSVCLFLIQTHQFITQICWKQIPSLGKKRLKKASSCCQVWFAAHVSRFLFQVAFLTSNSSLKLLFCRSLWWKRTDFTHQTDQLAAEREWKIWA